MSARSPFAVLAEDFSPGYRDGAAPNRLAPGATPEALNSWFYDLSYDDPRRVTMGRRPGHRVINNASIGSAGKGVDGLFEFRKTGSSPALLAVCDGDLFQWNGSTAFTAVAGGNPFGAGGAPVRAVPFRENLVLVNGTFQGRWTGSTLQSGLGEIAPTAAPALAVAAGPGVTGTYEGYGVWYDSVLEHETSPSATSAAVVFANQQRQWTKPAGAPAANYTHWRIYCRRTDTYEFNFFRVGTVVVGTATLTESISDAARRDLGPLPSENDPAPTGLAIIAEWKGFGIGVVSGADEFSVSRQGDLQSWHPKHKFAVARGSGEPLTAAHVYGEDCLLMKGHRSWRLEGSRVPFEIKPIRGSFGTVCQEAGGEVGDLYYGWDREYGPYVTDTLTWEPLSRGRVTDVLGIVTRTALTNIRFGHSAKHEVVVWAIPVSGSTRCRMLLPYHYGLKTWLPPMTGLEWAAFVTFTDNANGTTATYAGDQWGKVYELFSGDRDGVPTTAPMTTLQGTVTGTASAIQLSDSAAAFFVSGLSGLSGIPIALKSPAGLWQFRTIDNNTATAVVVTSAFNPAPQIGWQYYIGAIEWIWWTPAVDAQDPFTQKAVDHLYIEARAASPTHTLGVKLRVDGDRAINSELDGFTFSAGSGGIWGVSLWGQALWGASIQTPAKREVRQTRYSVQFGFYNYVPEARFVLTAWGLTADPTVGQRATT
jgi:hypothetical protein